MKNKPTTVFLLASFLLFAGCAGPKTINGHEYRPYGLVNEPTIKDPNVTYELSAGSVIVSIIFMETVVIPVYAVGWDLYAPVSAKPGAKATP